MTLLRCVCRRRLEPRNPTVDSRAAEQKEEGEKYISRISARKCGSSWIACSFVESAQPKQQRRCDLFGLETRTSDKVLRRAADRAVPMALSCYSCRGGQAEAPARLFSVRPLTALPQA